MRLLILFVLLQVVVSCSSDEPNRDEIISINTDHQAQKSQNQRIDEVLNSQEAINFNLLVEVKDYLGNPLSDVELTYYDQTYVVDESGTTFLENVSGRKHINGLSFSKEGYFKAFKSFNVLHSDLKRLEVIMIQKSQSAKFYAQEGGSMSIGEVDFYFEAESIVTGGGQLYEGIVTIFTHHYDSNDENLGLVAPGQLIGLSDQNELLPLRSHGMVQVEMIGQSGEELEIREGYTVAMSIPTDDEAPESITLWNLNERNGIWIEEGTATKQEGRYDFDVSHFSIYNCDVFCNEGLWLDLIFKDQEGNRLNDDLINIYYDDMQIASWNSRCSDQGELQLFLCDATSVDYRFNISNCTRSEVYSFSQSGSYTITLETDRTMNVLLDSDQCLQEYISDSYIVSIDHGGMFSTFSGIIDGPISNSILLCESSIAPKSGDRLTLKIIRDGVIFNFEEELMVDEDEITVSLDLCNPEVVSDDFIVPFKDEEFKKRLEWYLKKEDITFGEAKLVDSLIIARDENIESFAGIEYFTNLKQFRCLRSSILDLDDFASNQNLEDFHIYSPYLKNFDGLQQLTNLKILRLRSANFNDLEPIKNLSNLEVLDVPNNKIQLLPDNLKWDKLKYIDISDNWLISLGALRNVSGLDSIQASNNQFENLDGLQNMKNLHKANFFNCQSLLDISALKDKSSMVELNLAMTSIRDYEDLKTLDNLEDLYLPYVGENYKELSDLKKLQNLKFGSFLDGFKFDPISMNDLKWIEPMRGLKSLHIANVGLKDIRTLKELKDLEEIWLSGNSLTQIPDMSDLNKLSNLHLPENNISSIDPFLNLNQLTYLRLWENPISAVDQQRLIDALPGVDIKF